MQRAKKGKALPIFACFAVFAGGLGLAAIFVMDLTAAQGPRGDPGAAEPQIPAAAPAEAPAAREASSAMLEQFFRTFDLNRNDRLELSEARLYYEWIEGNVPYRYDDENATDALAGFIVGDGRSGPDHHQTPQETFDERLGDCEDQNSLELAFYEYWNVSAYMAFVNAQSVGTYDHAITIVRAASTHADLVLMLGPVPFYHAAGRAGVEDGFYILVDNTYSNVFGMISGGIGMDKFQIYDTQTLAEYLEEPWPVAQPTPPGPDPLENARLAQDVLNESPSTFVAAGRGRGTFSEAVLSWSIE